MIDIFKTIREERDDFLKNEIEVVPGYNFSQYETIKKIHLYYNSQYEKSNYEEVNGVKRKKIFHNMSNWRCEIATKMIDMDVRDLTLISNNPEQDMNVYILEKELKVWLKTSEMGKLLNEISEQLPIYGTSVLQKTKNGAKVVDLRYLYNDQSTDKLINGRYTILKNFMSHKELRDMKGKWENVDYVIDNLSGQYKTGYDQNGVNTSYNEGGALSEGGNQINQPIETSPLVEVWERYGQVPLSWFTEKDSDENEYVLAKYFVAGIDAYTLSENGALLSEDGVVLYKEQIDEFPFKEVHYKKTKGRWLGIGVVETLFEPQRRMNEVKNQEARAIELASIQLFQTRDEVVASNILTDLENGDILRTKSEITPIATESREIAGFKSVSDDIDAHSDNLTFSRDVVSGENPPASATLGAIQIQTQQTTAVFDYKRENIGIFLSEFIQDLVFPQIEKDLNREHVLRLTGSFEELQKLRKNYAVNCANNEVIEAVINGKVIEQGEWDAYYQKYYTLVDSLGEKIWLKVKNNFFKNLDYYVDVVTTGENKNVFASIQNGSALLNLIAQDPTILQDPAKKVLLFKVMSNMGYRLSEIEQVDREQPLPVNQPNQNGSRAIQGAGPQEQAVPALA